MGWSHDLQSLSNLFFTLAACGLRLGPDLFFLKPIAGVQAQRWMGRDFRYFYSFIFHNFSFRGPEALRRVSKLRDLIACNYLYGILFDSFKLI